jgi:hypothetical protein
MAGADAKTLEERNLAIDECASTGQATRMATYLAEDFRYTHSNGLTQNKQEYVDAYAKRKDPPLRQLSENIVDIHDNIGIVRGNIDVIFSDGKPQLYLRYVRVWRLDGGQWMAIFQRTVLANDRKPGGN